MGGGFRTLRVGGMVFSKSLDDSLRLWRGSNANYAMRRIPRKTRKIRGLRFVRGIRVKNSPYAGKVSATHLPDLLGKSRAAPGEFTEKTREKKLGELCGLGGKVRKVT